MKALTLTLTLAAAIAFTSCTKEDIAPEALKPIEGSQTHQILPPNFDSPDLADEPQDERPTDVYTPPITDSEFPICQSGCDNGTPPPDAPHAEAGSHQEFDQDLSSNKGKGNVLSQNPSELIDNDPTIDPDMR